MAPRAYRLTNRATSTSATRDRILAAATDEYRARGVAGATLGAIARRAAVSRGTILHHFDGADGLLDAVLGSVLSELEVPDARLFETAADVEERARRFVDAMLRFYDRTNSWWEVFGPEIGNPTIKAREAEFWTLIGAFEAAAFGSIAEDRIVAAAIGALTHPVTLGSLRSRGLDLDEAIVVVADMVVDLLRRHGLSGP